ncbi:MAG TPA: glycosyl hydrolase [Solirubrobacteraceae bacterium]|nr:glycosyl hydrolase [Solirubrobacteraceae bacterium]
MIVVGVLLWAATGAEASARSSKAGIASSRYLKSDPTRLSALGATWAYDWSASAPLRDSQLEWVPMIWGSGSITPAVRRVSPALATECRRGRR